MTGHGQAQISIEKESRTIQNLVEAAKTLYISTYTDSVRNTDDGERLLCSVAPGRVNLIGEHTDYTGGYVFPMAIDFSTVCVGTGSIVREFVDDDGKKDKNASQCRCQIVSSNNDEDVVSFTSSADMKPLSPTDTDSSMNWANYVAGVVKQYYNDSSLGLPPSHSLTFRMAITGNVPLGSGLSSSASLEVSVAVFIEAILNRHYKKNNTEYLPDAKARALKCQKAENTFCDSPCGIMDQFVSSAAVEGGALLIDCRSLNYETVVMGSATPPESATSDTSSSLDTKSKPVFVVCNSNVTHSIAGGEYPIRVQQCKEATEILKKLRGSENIRSLRDLSLSDVEEAKDQMKDVIYRRAKHVVTENERTLKAKDALLKGDWVAMGKLMNESHASMKIDYEVSCEEIDKLADLAQNFDGVYGSRLTGGGFGGCTVSLVDRDRVEPLCDYLRKEYHVWSGGKKECLCFESSPGAGAREILL